jgi:hypothetical protein
MQNGQQFIPTDFNYKEVDIDEGEDEEEESCRVIGLG